MPDGLAVQESVLGRQNLFQIEAVSGQGVGLGQGKAVPLVLPIKAEGKAEDKVIGVNGGAVVEHELFGHALPSRPRGRFDHRGEAVGEKCTPFTQVDHVENDELVPLRVLHRKMKPESMK